MLSGNRNFEGRINPDVKMNYLASPPLVVAYALAGSMDVDLFNDPLGQDTDGNDVFLKDIWPTAAEIEEVIAHAITSDMFTDDYADVFAGDERWQNLDDAVGRHVRVGQRVDVRPEAAVLRRHGTGAECRSWTSRARGCSPSSATRSPPTTSRPPVRSRRTPRPGKYLAEHGVAKRDFNSYGSRRGNHEVMIRGTFANIRLRNQLAPGTEGGFTVDLTQTASRSHDLRGVASSYLAAGTPLVILAGKEYGSGSSRDWAAKGTALLGVKAVIAESYERIHRSNLIGMGVLPLQYPEGQSAESLGLTGEETFSFTGVTALNEGSIPKTVKVQAGDVEFDATVRIDTPGEADYYRHGGIMQYVLRNLLQA